MGCGCKGGARNTGRDRPAAMPRQPTLGGTDFLLGGARSGAESTAAPVQAVGMTEDQRKAYAERRRAIQKALGK